MQMEMVETRKAFIKWLAPRDWDLACTFTFRDGVAEEEAKRTCKHFFNMVDKEIFGNAARKYGKRCLRACFI